MIRPMPPVSVLEAMHDAFEPAPDVEQWARNLFIEEFGELSNPDHEHLRGARLGFLWTNVENVKRGKLLLGMCQLMPPGGEKWGAGRAGAQIERWFGEMPDFLITLFAPACAVMDNPTFMALVEHELLHAAQDIDRFGMPAFNKKTGQPIWAMRSHDVEEFVGVVRRYGADAAGVREMVSAANKGPEIAAARIERACGSCIRLVK